MKTARGSQVVQESIKLELDDVTVERLQAAADDRDVDLDELLAQLLVVASGLVDDLLPRS